MPGFDFAVFIHLILSAVGVLQPEIHLKLIDKIKCHPKYSYYFAGKICVTTSPNPTRFPSFSLHPLIVTVSKSSMNERS